MSITKQFIEQIENKSYKIANIKPELSRFECLESAVLQLTLNEKHFSDLNPLLQNQLLDGQSNIDIVIKRKAQKLSKEQGISHTMARRKISAEFGIQDSRNITEIANRSREIETEQKEKLRKITGRALVDNLIDYLKLPALDVEELNKRTSCSVLIEHFDFIKVPLSACKKSCIQPVYVADNYALFPIAVVKDSGGVRDYQLDQEAMEWVLSVIYSHQFEKILYTAKACGDSIDFYETIIIKREA